MNQQYDKTMSLLYATCDGVHKEIQTKLVFETFPKTFRVLPSISHLLLLVDAVECVPAPFGKNMFPKNQSPKSSESLPA